MDEAQREAERARGQKAVEDWHVTAVAEYDSPWPGRPVRYVEAEADTMSRYVVVATPLPTAAAAIESGPVLVTVVWPWQDSKVMQFDGMLHEGYVAEHLTDHRSADGRLSMADLMALTMTVRHALGRQG